MKPLKYVLATLALSLTIGISGALYGPQDAQAASPSIYARILDQATQNQARQTKPGITKVACYRKRYCADWHRHCAHGHVGWYRRHGHRHYGWHCVRWHRYCADWHTKVVCDDHHHHHHHH